MQISSFSNRIVAVVVGAALLGVGGGIAGSQAVSSAPAESARTTYAFLPPAAALVESATPREAADEVASEKVSAEDMQFALNPALKRDTATTATVLPAQKTYTPAATRRTVAPRTVAVNNTTRNRTVSRSSTVYQAPPVQQRKRSFWDKHRDKLTVAIGAGAGAALGGAIGGKKGALIGAAAGGGSSALYTYKIRKRNKRY